MKPSIECAALALLCAILSLPSDVQAVNLVPNESFETYNNCPTAYSQIYEAAPWDAPTAGTSDYYNACVTGFPTFPVPGVPSNPFGFQTARTGVGYAGIIVLNGIDYREYIQVPLTSPLLPGNTYLVRFYVNLGDVCDTAIDRLGAYFSVGPVGPLAINTPLAFIPQVESPAATFLNDTVNWTVVSGTFVAAGGESHMIIGNFHDDANTATLATGNTWPGANYFVGDVSVELQLPTLQACCTADGLCSMQFPGECEFLGGTPLGTGSTCDGNPCGTVPTANKSWGMVKTIYR